MDYVFWANKAIMKIGTLEDGKIFTLKSLFTGIEWDELTNGERKSFGRYFKNEVRNRKISSVQIAEELKTNKYKKVK